MFKKFTVAMFIAMSVFSLSSCDNPKDEDPRYQARVRNGMAMNTFHFDDMAFPRNTRIDSQRSIIHNRENSDYWTGNIYGTTPYEPRGVFTFYERSLAKLGWTKISTSREKEGSLVFEKNERICQVIIADDGSNGSYLSIIVSETGDY